MRSSAPIYSDSCRATRRHRNHRVGCGRLSGITKQVFRLARLDPSWMASHPNIHTVHLRPVARSTLAWMASGRSTRPGRIRLTELGKNFRQRSQLILIDAPCFNGTPKDRLAILRPTRGVRATRTFVKVETRCFKRKLTIVEHRSHSAVEIADQPVVIDIQNVDRTDFLANGTSAARTDVRNSPA
jgi:hypothetical protein